MSRANAPGRIILPLPKPQNIQGEYQMFRNGALEDLGWRFPIFLTSYRNFRSPPHPKPQNMQKGIFVCGYFGGSGASCLIQYVSGVVTGNILTYLGHIRPQTVCLCSETRLGENQYTFRRHVAPGLKKIANLEDMLLLA